MEATIIEADEGGIDVRVTDANAVTHTISVGFDGEIQAHSQDSYAETPAERDPPANEAVNQACRYARYHVWQERGHEALPWDEDITRIEPVADAVAALSAEEFQEHFGLYYQTVARAVTLNSFDVDELITSLQEGADAYQIDVFLDDNGRVDTTANMKPVAGRDGWDAELEAPYARRVPNARIELPSVPLPSAALLQRLIVHQIRCQIRDFYLAMGVEPPAEYRVLGYGKHKFAVKYRDETLDMYEDYTRLDVDIPGYTIGMGLDDHPQIAQQVKQFLSSLTDT